MCELGCPLNPNFYPIGFNSQIITFWSFIFSLADEFRIETLSVSIKVPRNKKNYKITVCINHKLNSIRVCIPILNSVYIIQIQDLVLSQKWTVQRDELE